MSSLVAQFDSLRALVLRQALSFESLRRIFISRSQRLLLSFVLAGAINFFLALFFPIWVILIGPLIFGLPHLFSGARFIPKLLFEGSEKKGIYACGFLVLTSGIFHLISPGGPGGWDLGVMALLGSYFLIKRLSLIPILFFSSVLVGTWTYPLLTLGLLALGHNFVAFAYWYKSGQNENEKFTALICFGLFILASLFFFTPIALRMSEWFATIPTPDGVSLLPFILGKQIFPAASNPDFLFSIMSAFAFGQSMHYFVWLKAVPEQTISQSVPLSFRQSARSLSKDFGFWGVTLIIALCALPFLGMIFLRLETLRNLYISFATTHGYIELAGLPFLFNSKKS